MITRGKQWEKIDTKLRSNQVVSPRKARQIFNGLYRQAVALGFKKRRFSLDDLEADFRLAKALNPPHN